MEKYTNHIYSCLKRYNKAIEKVGKEDVKQEIRFAILTAKPEFIYKVASRLVYNLLTDFGFSRKKGKDNFDSFYQEIEFTEKEKKMLYDIEQYYQVQDNTAKETAQKFGFEHNNKVAKILATCFPKHKSNRLNSKKIKL